MSCKISPSNVPILRRVPTNQTIIHQSSRLRCRSQGQELPVALSNIRSDESTIEFRTLKACKLGISRYPDFEYDAEGGAGTAIGMESADGEISVSFGMETLYIPPLTGATTRFLGLPLPPFLRIDIAPEVLEGTVDKDSGKVDLYFRAKFLFSIGRMYRAPPLLVETMLTSEETKGSMKKGRGERMNREGRCQLVGVATIDPIDDLLMNSFLGLPTDCVAVLNARICISCAN